MLNLLNIVSMHDLREVGELLRRASIKQRLSFMRKKLLGGVMVKAFLPCKLKEAAKERLCLMSFNCEHVSISWIFNRNCQEISPKHELQL